MAYLHESQWMAPNFKVICCLFLCLGSTLMLSLPYFLCKANTHRNLYWWSCLSVCPIHINSSYYAYKIWRKNGIKSTTLTFKVGALSKAHQIKCNAFLVVYVRTHSAIIFHPSSLQFEWIEDDESQTSCFKQHESFAQVRLILFTLLIFHPANEHVRGLKVIPCEKKERANGKQIFSV